MSIQFGDEYMDENPISGEPGSFRFMATTRDVKKRKQDEEAAAVKAREQKENASRAVSPKVEKAPSPPAIFTEAKVSGKSEKDKLSEKKRRRKSRPNAQSPTTPGSATNASASMPAG